MHTQKSDLVSPLIIKLLLSCSFILLAIISYSLYNGDFFIYSLYFYSNIPKFNLLSLLFIEFIGIFSVIMLVRKSDYPYILNTSIILIILCNILILFLPYIQGYEYPSGGDHLSHIGLVKDILIENKVPPNLVYPMTHILIVEECYFMNLPVESVVRFTGPTFYLLFLLFLGMLSKLYTNRSITIFSILSGTVLFSYYYINIFPMGFSFTLYPLLFYLYIKQKASVSFRIVFFIFLLINVFFHVVSAALFILLFILLEIGYNIIENIDSSDKIKTYSLKLQLVPAIVTSILLLLWIWNFYNVWNNSVISVMSWFDEELLTKPMTSVAYEAFEKLEYTTLDILVLFTKKYGHIFAYLILGTLASIKLFKDTITKNNTFLRLIPYSIVYVVISIIWLVDYIRPLTSLTSGRLIWLMISLFPLLVGYFLSEYLRANPNYLRIFIVIVVITSVSFIGIFSIHPSPFVNVPNSALTQSSVCGPIWLLQNGNDSISVIGAGTPEFYRVSSAKWGSNHRIDLNWESQVIDHFGYTQNKFLGENYNSSLYLILRPDYLIEMYRVLYPTISRYDKNDFYMLSNDASVNYIYNNGEVFISCVDDMNSSKYIP